MYIKIVQRCVEIERQIDPLPTLFNRMYCSLEVKRRRRSSNRETTLKRTNAMQRTLRRRGCGTD